MRGKLYGKILIRYLPVILLEFSLLSFLIWITKDEPSARKMVYGLFLMVLVILVLTIFREIFRFERSLRVLDTLMLERLKEDFSTAQQIGPLYLTSAVLVLSSRAGTVVIPYENIMSITWEGASPVQSLMFNMKAGLYPKIYQANFHMKLPQTQMQELICQLNSYIQKTALPKKISNEQKQQYQMAQKNYRVWFLSSPSMLMGYAFLHLFIYLLGFLAVIRLEEWIKDGASGVIFWGTLAQLIWLYGFGISGFCLVVWGMLRLFGKQNREHLAHGIGKHVLVIFWVVIFFELFLAFAYSADQNLIERLMYTFP